MLLLKKESKVTVYNFLKGFYALSPFLLKIAGTLADENIEGSTGKISKLNNADIRCFSYLREFFFFH